MYRMIDVCMLLQLSIRVPLALRCCYGRRRICVTSACPSIDVCTPRCASIDSQGSDSMSVVTQHRLRMALMTVTGFDWRPLRATVTINECRLHRTTCPVRGAPWCPVRPVRPRMPPHAPACPRMPRIFRSLINGNYCEQVIHSSLLQEQTLCVTNLG